MVVTIAVMPVKTAISLTIQPIFSIHTNIEWKSLKSSSRLFKPKNRLNANGWHRILPMKKMTVLFNSDTMSSVIAATIIIFLLF